jgi:biotin synthase-related radical SAM superfamily protein
VKRVNKKNSLPRQIRVSVGSAIMLGLLNARLDASPTTIYLMTYRRGKCSANCGFCPQARESHGRTDMLSRVSWPVYQTKPVLSGIARAHERADIKRVCLQALNYPEVFAHLTALVKMIFEQTHMPISVSCQPSKRENIVQLADAGAERIGIPLDAAVKSVFTRIKGSSAGGPYTWEGQFQMLHEALRIFGKGRVSTHLIVGLGETQREMIETIQECVDMTVLPALFAFTPISGTTLASRKRPPIEAYRRIQVARHLIWHGIARYEDMSFDDRGMLVNFGVDEDSLMKVVETGEPFLTCGCPDCNRPFYNEKPSGPIYNYPIRLREEELLDVKKQLGFL